MPDLKQFREPYLNDLKGYQKRYLKGLAHRLKPVVSIGQKGITDAVIQSIDAALETHELIKVKFIGEKDKVVKHSIFYDAALRANSQIVGVIGHVGILYRPCADPDKRTIRIPNRQSD